MNTNKQSRHTPSREADTELGKRAHVLIWSSSLTQGKVAKMLGMSSDSLGRKLKGERGWAIAEVIAIAEILGTTVAYLVGETQEAPHPHNTDEGPSEPPVGLEPTTCALQGGTFSPIIDIFTGREAA